MFYIRNSRLFWIYGEKIVNSFIRIYTNKIENRFMFKIKTGYYLELLSLETMEVTCYLEALKVIKQKIRMVKTSLI